IEIRPRYAAAINARQSDGDLDEACAAVIAVEQADGSGGGSIGRAGQDKVLVAVAVKVGPGNCAFGDWRQNQQAVAIGAGADVEVESGLARRAARATDQNILIPIAIG